jgi:uncharacterized membrane protein YhaH (DUF805 family)
MPAARRLSDSRISFFVIFLNMIVVILDVVYNVYYLAIPAILKPVFCSWITPKIEAVIYTCDMGQTVGSSQPALNINTLVDIVIFVLCHNCDILELL